VPVEKVENSSIFYEVAYFYRYFTKRLIFIDILRSGLFLLVYPVCL